MAGKTQGRYHFTDDYKLVRCRATKRPCPKGGPHFDTIEEGNEYRDKYLADKFSATRFKKLSTNTLESELKNKKSKTSKILELSKRKSTGFNYEVFMANNYARSQGLNNVMVRNEETGRWNTKAFSDHTLSKEEAQLLYKKARKAVRSAYGKDIDTKSAIKVIYYDKVDSGKIFVQTGSNQTLDGLIANDNEFRVLEIKRTHKKGAQLEEHLISIGSNGEYNIEDSRLTDEVYNVVNNRTAYDNDKDSDVLKISPEGSLRQFTKDYKTRGVDEFVFTDKEGKPYSIDMTQPEDKCVQDLLDAGITAEIKIRTNLSTSRMDKASIDRIKNNKNNLYSGKIDKDGFLTIGQINKDKIKETGKSTKYIRFGEFKTNIKAEDWRTMDKNTKINIKDLRYFRPILSGNIKIREGATPISQLW